MKKMIQNKIICVILSTILFLGNYSNKPIYGESTIDGNYEFIYEYNRNDIFTAKVTGDGAVYFFGKHSKSKSQYTYHTTGFLMTLNSTGQAPGSVSNKVRIIRRDVPTKDKVKVNIFNSNQTTLDVYLVDSQDVTTNLITLLKNQGYTSQRAYKKIAEGVDVYFSNIFEVVTRADQKRVGTEEYYSYQDILNAIYDLTGQHWTDTTRDILAYYYDNPIHIKLSPFFYNVVYVDSKDYAKNGTNAKKLATGPTNQEIYFGQKTGFEIPSNHKISLNGKQYNIQSAEYVYANGKKNTTNLPTISAKEIEAYHGVKENATMYVLVNQTTLPPPVIKPTSPPSSSENSISYFEPNPTANINVQPIPKTGYDTKIGVPTTEKLYGTIQTSEYLLNIVYEKISGEIIYPITVQKTYYVTTKDPPKLKKDGTIDKTAKDTYTTTAETVTQSGNITRGYSYTEISSIDYYKIKNGTVTNQTLPGETITLLPNRYSVPNLRYEHYESPSKHLKAPSGVGSTIVLTSSDVSSVPSEDLISIADLEIGQISVRNDALTFGDSTVLSSSWKSKTAVELKRSAIPAPKKTAQQILYQDNLLIEKTLLNQTYPSSGTITYEKVVSFNSTLNDTLTYSISNINDVKIHTPVYCKTLIAHDNNAYLQLINPDETSIPLILDENSAIGDFTLQISNQGYHSNQPGYGEKDYSKYLAKIDGVPQNEVKFPIEMYEDIGNDGDTANDILIKPETWTCIGTSEQRFYAPMWTQEGIYTVEVRSVAVNGSNLLTQAEESRNTLKENYVAVDSFTIQTSGRLYGLTMYDIQDYPLWKDVFRESDGLTLKENTAYSKQVKNASVDLTKLANGTTGKGFHTDKVYDYTIGLNNSFGIATGRKQNYTMPLMVGAHPKYKNEGMVKAGYTMRFRVNTNGDVMAQKDSTIRITPRFYYVDSSGKNRREVDLYYQGTVQGKKYSLIQIGSSADQSNKRTITVGDVMQAIPKEEITVNAKLLGMSNAKFCALTGESYTYDNITVKSPFRMYSNIGFAKAYKNSSHSEDELQKLKQTFYFSYSLPNKVRAVDKGTDVVTYAKQKGITFKEDFWLKNGYLIVNFDITAVDASGNVRYSYINQDNYVNKYYCSMWLMEGGAVKKTDANGLSIQFLAGDALILPTDKTASDDYTSDGIY